MRFQQVKPKKIYEEVAEQIETMIVTKQLQPGTKIASVEALAEQFQVGRSAVREALSALRARGYLEMRQGEGTYVREYDQRVVGHAISSAILMNPRQIRELLEVRKFLEVGAAGIAAEHHSETDLQAMRLELHKMAQHLDDEAIGERADVAFHLAIAQAGGNKLLEQLMHTVAETMTATIKESRRLWLYADSASAKKLLHEHEAIFEAIKSGDRQQAERIMFQHLDKVEQTVYRLLEEGQV